MKSRLSSEPRRFRLPDCGSVERRFSSSGSVMVEATADWTSPRGMEKYIAGRTLVSGDSPAWRDLFVQVYSRHSNQQPFLVPAVAELLVVWVISGEAIVEERDVDGEWFGSHVKVGDFFLTRSQSPYEMRWRAIGAAPFQVMHLYLSVPLLERVARELLGCSPAPALREVSGGHDKQLSHLLALIHQELSAEGRGSQLFVQGLAQTLAVHLIRNYASGDADDKRNTALPGFKLRRAVTYLEEHLAEPFSLAPLAEIAGMSEFHFSRLFKKATGLSPSRYFIRQRVAKAQQLLQETDRSILAVGMAVGYSSPSHFGQVFRRETGVTPSHYRRG